MRTNYTNTGFYFTLHACFGLTDL